MLIVTSSHEQPGWWFATNQLRLEDVEIFLIAIVALRKNSDPQYYETLVKHAKEHPDAWSKLNQVELLRGGLF